MSRSDPKTNMSTSRDHRRQLYEQLVGKLVAGGRFRITRLLGFGGMGAVYEALQLNMNRPVALKLIPTHDPTTVARFEREALTISQLRHPNTVTVFDYGRTEDGFLFLAMEMLDGVTLSDLIKSTGPLPPRQAVHIAAQICRSLNEAHHAGIVHRDIKPDNIILINVDGDDSVVKVLDFGIAKAVIGEDDVQLTGDGRIIGTPRYMSPEQILAEPLDHRSDIYSLGCIIFEMLTGAPPFQQSSTTALMISHTQDAPPAFAQRLNAPSLEKIPPYLESVVRKSLAKDPNHRQQTTEELRRELEGAMGAIPVGQSQQYLSARLSSTSQSGVHSRTSSQSGLLVASAAQTGNHAQPHPITGTFNPSMQPGLPQSGVHHVPQAATSGNRTPLIAIVVLLLAAGVAFVGYAMVKKFDTMPSADAVVTAPTPTVPTQTTLAPPDEVPPKTLYASVELATEPPGARIIRDGVDTKKVTPALMTFETGKNAEVRFELDGYHTYEAQIIPEAGSKVNATLAKLETNKTSRSADRHVVKRTPKVEPKVESEHVEEKAHPEPDTAPKVPMLDDEQKVKVERLD